MKRLKVPVVAVLLRKLNVSATVMGKEHAYEMNVRIHTKHPKTEAL